jgi:hypothetical protein
VRSFGVRAICICRNAAVMSGQTSTQVVYANATTITFPAKLLMEYGAPFWSIGVKFSIVLRVTRRSARAD